MQKAKSLAVVESEIKGISMLDKVRQIKGELNEALAYSSHSRYILFGEAESGIEGQEGPQPDTIGVLLHDILTQACNLRGDLERMADNLHPRLKSPKKVGHAG